MQLCYRKRVIYLCSLDRSPLRSWCKENHRIKTGKRGNYYWVSEIPSAELKKIFLLVSLHYQK